MLENFREANENDDHHYNYRSDTRGGVVSAYIHNDIKHYPIVQLTYEEGNNYLWIHLERLALNIGVVYKLGHTNLENFLKIYGKQLQQRKRSIIFGDFNIDLLTRDKSLTKYRQTIKESGYELLNKINKDYCTRDSGTKKSIIDHLSTNLKCEPFNLAITNSSMSDHKQIFLQLNRYKPPRKIRTVYEAIDYKKFHAEIESCGLKDAADNYEDFELKLKQCKAHNRVLKTKILNTPKKRLD
ncbi:unnamed protein product [Euphydryas editha]|uniref:Endonuclease/exonuclease/phosphatase domain-containing protein n=1 Tax=Euphydryas editha TaxID=104508 RepID=A0AAU9U0W1_EUPED|nr:unnamed protein product [Euphydryas editha]